jgi:hypothetical protein
MKPTKQIPPSAARQLAMALDSAKLRGMSPAERSETVALLASLLRQAAGDATAESDDDRV